MNFRFNALRRGMLIGAAFVMLFGCDVEVNHYPAEPFGAKRSDKPWPFDKAENPTGLSLSLDALASQNIYIVFDGSGSMEDRACNDTQRKIAVAKQAINEFLRHIPQTTNVGVYAFDSRGMTERVALGRENREALDIAVGQIRVGGATPLATAITTAYDKLTEQGRKQLGYGEYHLVVITDGEASSGEDPRSIVNRVIGESPVIIHTIGFCIDDRHSLNQPGRVIYKTANDKASLQQGLQAVLAEAPDYQAATFK